MKPKQSRPPLSLINLAAEAEAGTAPDAADTELFETAAPVAVTVARPREREGLARHAMKIAVASGAVWAGSLIAFVLGFKTRFGAFGYEPFQIAIVAALAILPFSFMLLAAHAIRQGSRLAAATRGAREMAQDLAIPAALAADQVGGAMAAMRLEIERAAEAAQAAQAPLAALRACLSEETAKLNAAAQAASEAGRGLNDALARERAAVGDASQALRARADETADALTAQARLVAEASDLAQMQLAEAQAGLAARAADLSLAAAGTEAAADRAGEALARQTDRLERASEAVTQNLGRLQVDMSREREQLFALAGGLRDDQTAFAVAAEARARGLAAAVADAREGADAVTGATLSAQDSLRALIASAAAEMKRLADAAQNEQAALDATARATLEAFGGEAAAYREAIEAQTRASLADFAAAAEETRNAAALPIEEMAERLELRARAVLAELDQLGEAAFAAGQKADQAFDNRMALARAMIEQSAELVDEAGLRAGQRISSGLSGAREAVDDLAALLDIVERRLAELPDSAREKAETVRAAVERGAADLAQAARRTAEETQAIDAAFQERVRRNYEVLSEAVRLMGRVAAAAEPPVYAAPLAAAPPPPRPAPPAASAPPPVRTTDAVLEDEEEIAAPIAVGDRSMRTAMGLQSSATAFAPDAGLRPAALTRPALSESISAAAAGLRPRLRLTPSAAEAAPAAPPSLTPAPAPIAKDGDEWTWKELLSSIEERPAADDDGLAARLIAEIEALGVDSEALLPPARTEEIAAVLHTGDSDGAREVVGMLAGAAVRRLSGRLLADEVLREQADQYIQRYITLLLETARRDQEGYMTASLLGSDQGRAFLLLDAASGALH